MNVDYGLDKNNLQWRYIEVYLDNNNGRTQIALNGRLTGIVRLQLDEISITNGTSTPLLLRFEGGGFSNRNLNNKNINGTILPINTTDDRVIYTTPRIISDDIKDSMSALNIVVTNVDGTAATFSTLYLKFTVLMIPTRFDAQDRAAYRNNLSHMEISAFPNSYQISQMRGDKAALPFSNNRLTRNR